MTQADSVRFAQLITVLAETYNSPFSVMRAEVYRQTLDDLSIDDLERAVFRAVQTIPKFCPTPAELREIVEGSKDGAANEAWAAFFHAVSHHRAESALTAATVEAARLAFGDMTQARRILPDGSDGTAPALQGFRKQFISCFHTAKEREAFGALEVTRVLSQRLEEIRQFDQRNRLAAGKPAERVVPPARDQRVRQGKTEWRVRQEAEKLTQVAAQSSRQPSSCARWTPPNSLNNSDLQRGASTDPDNLGSKSGNLR